MRLGSFFGCQRIPPVERTNIITAATLHLQLKLEESPLFFSQIHIHDHIRHL